MKSTLTCAEEVHMNNIVRNGILLALALVLSIAERWVPLAIAVPVPGIKLGLANVVTMFALLYLGIRSAIIVTVLRCLLAAIFYGGIISLALSLAGGLSALMVMAALKAGKEKWISLLGISIGGAAAHNAGQVFMASLLLYSPAVFSYLSILLVAAVATGLLTGTVALHLFNKLERIGFLKDVPD